MCEHCFIKPFKYRTEDIDTEEMYLCILREIYFQVSTNGRACMCAVTRSTQGMLTQFKQSVQTSNFICGKHNRVSYENDSNLLHWPSSSTSTVLYHYCQDSVTHVQTTNTLNLSDLTPKYRNFLYLYLSA